jgi:PERQ amino acid-rich with GYF domain-containing protein
METRYSRDQLLDLFRAQREARDLDGDLNELYVGEGENGVTNGEGGAKWARREDTKDNGVGVDICWNRLGGIEPLGLIDMTDEEREVCQESRIFKDKTNGHASLS